LIAVGTVGWTGEDPHFEKDQDGYTVVKVTLFAGRDFTKDIEDPTVAQGQKILCHISGGIFRVPPPGTRVYVAMPDGMEEAVGSGCIIATVEKTAALDQHEDDRVVMDFGTDTHVVIKGKSVSLQDHPPTAGTPSCFIGVGTPRAGGVRGISAVTEEGAFLRLEKNTCGMASVSGGAIKSIFQLGTDTCDFGLNGDSCMQLKAGKCTIYGQTTRIPGTCYLGPAPTNLTGVQVGVAGTPSTTVYATP
jgi:hypothetical protein